MIDTISKEQDLNQLSSSSRGADACLYVVATPIGNLADISQRALEVLANVDIILAEDTRHSKRLLNHYGISTRLKSCHEHNEFEQIEWVKAQLDNGQSLALISDAGTPLISDPGFVLVRALRQSDYSVMVVPGASSIIAALSISGLPTDGFVYDGFLPSKSAARKKALAQYINQTRTAVLLESSHRIQACVQDIVEVLGEGREIVVARELTKRFETVLGGSAIDVLQSIAADDNQTRGEFVVMLSGAEPVSEEQAQINTVLRVLLKELPVKQASGIAAKLSGLRKNDVYQMALALKKEMED
ncbi:MAG: 16S rRNA (cytidine(1402)-2'-O)-methyltransferase [Acidiferrobacterales bacterium]|nr:16S rRNA (cytidine(1402)-2'-O)-methyltransferase [Acidiferrobacterales bacterium]